jgi:hypothetical protein
MSNIVKQIRKQQLECSHHVYIELLTEEKIKELLIDGNYFYAERDGKILVSFYIRPLLESFKLYRLGGFVISDVENPSFIILKNFKNYVFKYNIDFMSKSETISLESFLFNMGAKKVSFEECLTEYPLFLKAYINKSIETKDFFKSKIFYIREANNT